MLALTLRGLVERKLRAILTAVSVVLGVALMAGTYVFTDTINASFDKLFATATKGTDVRIRPRQIVQVDNADPPALAESYLATVRRTPGVAQAAGGIFRTGAIFRENGKIIGGTTGAPKFIASADPKRFDSFVYKRGRAPSAGNEMALDSLNARKQKLQVGDRVRLGGVGATRTYDISGIAEYAGGSSLGGAVIAIVTLPEAQRITGQVGKVDAISVAAAPGTTPDQLRARLRAELPRSLDVRTGQQDAAKQSKDIRDNLSFLRTFLLVFAIVALFVGAFIIFNTFSITVAQRTKEFALLRTLGASRRQVTGAVVIEALLIGLVASIVGLGVGVALAPALKALFNALGIDLPNQGLVLLSRTVIVALVVGTVVTLIAGLVPARRATRVPPILAVQEGAVLPVSARRRRWNLILALALTAGGVALMSLGLFGGGSSGKVTGLLGGGAAVLFIGVAMLSPRLVRPLASAVGRPLERVFGVTGRIARENSVRNPSRTAITAAALMIGLALVSFVAIFADGIKSSINDSIETGLRGQLVVQNRDGFTPIPAESEAEIARVPGVAQVSGTRFSNAKVRGISGTASVSSLDPLSASKVFKFDWKRGSDATLGRLRFDEAIVDDKWAKDHGIKVGDSLQALTPTNKRVRYVVAGSVDNRSQIIGDFAISNVAIERDLGVQQDSLQLLLLSPGADVGQVKGLVKQVLARGYPQSKALTKQEFKDKQTGSLNTLLGLIYALLALAVIISLFGIVNTLALSIYERQRELGMLRAIGMSRRQVRKLIRYEAVITAMIGAVLGTVLGIFFAVIISRPLADEGFILSFPIGTLIALLVLAALAGVVSAIGPARRASRLPVLESIHME